MSHQSYKVKCLDARYDKEAGFLVLNCLFIAFDSPRIVCLSKNDFTFNGSKHVPDSEMEKTAMLFSSKKPEFSLVVADDPNKEQINDDNYSKYVGSFNSKISDELGKVSQGLVDDAGQISRKLGHLMDEGKLDAEALLRRELAVRAKIGG